MEYTKEQVIQFTINILSEVKVPATKASEIGVPIEKSINNLLVVQEMMEAEKNQQHAEKKETIEDESMDVGGEENVQTGR